MNQLRQVAKCARKTIYLWNALNFWRFVRVVSVDDEGKGEGAAFVHA